MIPSITVVLVYAALAGMFFVAIVQTIFGGAPVQVSLALGTTAPESVSFTLTVSGLFVQCQPS